MLMTHQRRQRRRWRALQGGGTQPERSNGRTSLRRCACACLRALRMRAALLRIYTPTNVTVFGSSLCVLNSLALIRKREANRRQAKDGKVCVQRPCSSYARTRTETPGGLEPISTSHASSFANPLQLKSKQHHSSPHIPHRHPRVKSTHIHRPLQWTSLRCG